MNPGDLVSMYADLLGYHQARVVLRLDDAHKIVAGYRHQDDPGSSTQALSPTDSNSVARYRGMFGLFERCNGISGWPTPPRQFQLNEEQTDQASKPNAKNKGGEETPVNEESGTNPIVLDSPVFIDADQYLTWLAEYRTAVDQTIRFPIEFSSAVAELMKEHDLTPTFEWTVAAKEQGLSEDIHRIKALTASSMNEHEAKDRKLLQLERELDKLRQGTNRDEQIYAAVAEERAKGNRAPIKTVASKFSITRQRVGQIMKKQEKAVNRPSKRKKSGPFDI